MPNQTKYRLPRPQIPLASLALAAALTVPMIAHAEPLKTVVVGLQARRGVDPALAMAMSDVVQGEVVGDTHRTVFGRSDIERVLEFESEKQALGCVDDSCLAEIASAMDVDRIITGSMDKIGSSYYVVVTEIDAEEVRPIARVQQRLPTDEDKLFDSVAALTRELLHKSAGQRPAEHGSPDAHEPSTSGAPGAGGGDETIATANAGGPKGRLIVTTSPPGAEVRLGSKTYRTPVTIDEVPPGKAEIGLRLDGGDAVPIAVPIFDGQATEVTAEREEGGPPSREAMKVYEAEQSLNRVYTGGLVGGGLLSGCGAPFIGLVGCLPPTVLAVMAVGQNSTVVNWTAIYSYLICGGLSALLSVGLCTWGGVQFFLGPDAPTEKGPVHSVVVIPPKDKGDVTYYEFDALPAPPAGILDETDSGETDSDEHDSGATDSGETDSGETDSGADSAEAPDDPEPSEGDGAPTETDEDTGGDVMRH